ncbi:MAG TPA: class IV adenylate cyclase [Flavisolibacter sp.]|jgi:predicted adenylyl cyclase CyaB|nr:class IV adenylate cyclase [Flavisolibacter sp.]
MPTNFEFKAKHEDIEAAENILLKHNPVFIGEDHQVDTYFNVPNGRLKLREGTIEQVLIFYERSNNASAKQSNVTLYPHKPDSSLKQVLSQSLGIKVVIKKTRKIYFIDNVKFHFDVVVHLGTFIEVEAIDKEGSIGVERLKEQCVFYQALFAIDDNQFIADSYSDLVLAKNSSII